MEETSGLTKLSICALVLTALMLAVALIGKDPHLSSILPHNGTFVELSFFLFSGTIILIFGYGIMKSSSAKDWFLGMICYGFILFGLRDVGVQMPGWVWVIIGFAGFQSIEFRRLKNKVALIEGKLEKMESSRDDIVTKGN